MSRVFTVHSGIHRVNEFIHLSMVDGSRGLDLKRVNVNKACEIYNLMTVLLQRMFMSGVKSS